MGAAEFDPVFAARVDRKAREIYARAIERRRLVDVRGIAHQAVEAAVREVCEEACEEAVAEGRAERIVADAGEVLYRGIRPTSEPA